MGSSLKIRNIAFNERGIHEVRQMKERVGNTNRVVVCVLHSENFGSNGIVKLSSHGYLAVEENNNRSSFNGEKGGYNMGVRKLPDDTSTDIE